MQNRGAWRPRSRWPVVGLAGAMLFGCGGGAERGAGSAGQADSVRVTETATVLSVRADLAADSSIVGNEMQALHLSLSGRIDTGPSAGMAFEGTLVLQGERHDDGRVEVEGQFFPEAVAIAASAAESALKHEFEGRRNGFKDALRADIYGLSAALKRELANDATANASERSAAQKETMATFKAIFEQRMIEYRAAVSALNTEYTVAQDGGAKPHVGNAVGATKIYGVRGTIDSLGTVRLTLDVGDKDNVLAIVLVDTDGSAKGSLTGPTSTDQGSWSATATL